MNENDILVKGALLHDIGKLCRRAYVKMGNHSKAGKDFLAKFMAENDDSLRILNCVSYHHADPLKEANLASDDLAYIVYEADNIAAGTDRREDIGEDAKDGFNSASNLLSIFTTFNSDKISSVQNKYSLRYKNANAVFNYPKAEVLKATTDEYKPLYKAMEAQFKSIDLASISNNQLLKLLEECFSYVPSSTSQKEICDISLYIHSKLTACIANCMKLYFDENNITDYREYCFKNNKTQREFKQTKSYLLVSGDISGIQKFIYTIPSKGALKTLRGRSVYLDLLLENFIDELLVDLELSRANLLYSGGGHFYLLAPNTIKAKTRIVNLQVKMNEWLIKNVGTTLYLAIGKAPCSSNDLKDSKSQGKLFAKVNMDIKIDKSSRYRQDPEAFVNLFTHQNHINDNDKLECNICHNLTDKLYSYTGKEKIACDFCLGLYKLGENVLDKNIDFVLSDDFNLDYNGCIKFFGNEKDYYMYPVAVEDIGKFGGSIVRVYEKNASFKSEIASVNLNFADYSATSQDNTVMSFDELSRKSQGIKRLGVLRADVDDLGIAFTSGFMLNDADNNRHYATLSRYAELSKDMSLFFKVAINKICSGDLNGIINPKTNTEYKPFSIFGLNKAKKRNISIVYSGGDDLFLVGAWDDILEVSMDIRRAFRQFTNDKMSFSAGMAMFSPTYPISKMAEITGALEDISKNMIDKDSISLFGFDTNVKDNSGITCRHIYKWQDFEQKVCQEKIQFLFDHLAIDGDTKAKLNVGKSLIYRLMDLLQLIDDDNLNIARFAYVLARMQPQNPKLIPIYDEFSKAMYKWINSDKDKKELFTALNLLLYYLRDKEE